MKEFILNIIFVGAAIVTLIQGTIYIIKSILEWLRKRSESKQIDPKTPQFVPNYKPSSFAILFN